MSARVFIKDDWMRDGLTVYMLPEKGKAVTWDSPSPFGSLTVIEVDERQEPPESTGLRLPTEIARALYESLADHFGHSGHDTRALRKDYEAERARVDRLIDFATSPATVVTEVAR